MTEQSINQSIFRNKKMKNVDRDRAINQNDLVTTLSQ